MRRLVNLTREELYALVWATPMQKLAPAYSLSDVGLKKVCVQNGIPTPPVGYWAKKQSGKRTRQTPLPTLRGEPRRIIQLFHEPDPKPRSKPEEPKPIGHGITDPELIELVSFEKDPKNRIVVSTQLRNLHPVIQTTLAAYSGKQRFGQYNHIEPEPGMGCRSAAIAVGPDSLTRALCLMNALFQALEKRGHHTEVRQPKPYAPRGGSCVRSVVLGEEIGFVLREKTKMIPIPEAEMSPRQRLSHRVNYVPTGDLELKLDAPHHSVMYKWVDNENVKLEDRLNDVAIALIDTVDTSRRHREWERQAAIDRLQREQESRDREQLQRAMRERENQFDSHANRWQRAETLRSFVQAVRAEGIRRLGQIEEDSGLDRWLTWATEHIRTIDPLSGAALPSIE